MMCSYLSRLCLIARSSTGLNKEQHLFSFISGMNPEDHHKPVVPPREEPSNPSSAMKCPCCASESVLLEGHLLGLFPDVLEKHRAEVALPK